MISQESIINALHSNKCPLCERKQMSAEMVTSRFPDGEFLRRYFVGCGFCCNRWEITSKTFNDHVRIMDTKSFKMEHGY